MTVMRSLLVSLLVFGFLFDQALEGFQRRECDREMVLLKREIGETRAFRDVAQDEFDAVLYASIRRRDPAGLAQFQPLTAAVAASEPG